LEQAGFLRRKPDPRDGRRQVLSPAPERAPDLAALFAPIQRDALELFDGFDDGQVTAIAEFLDRATRFVYRHSAMLRADAALSRPSPSAPTTQKLETRP
jgi:DNA-binding MarR family transcriptional regulator